MNWSDILDKHEVVADMFCDEMHDWFGKLNREDGWGYGEWDTSSFQDFVKQEPEFIKDLKDWNDYNFVKYKDREGKIELFRGIRKETDKDKKITSWTSNEWKAKEWAGKDGTVVKKSIDKKDIILTPEGVREVVMDVCKIYNEDDWVEMDWVDTWLNNEQEYIVRN